jgi:hypothetical protein
MAAVCSLLVGMPVLAGAVSVSGESTTIFRLRETTEKKNIYPLYEYLNLSATDFDKDGALSFYVGGWGRVDLGDRSTDKYYNQDLQYGYLNYRGKQNNFVVNLGRQFVTEGVAAERIDGIYARSDLAAGFGASAFVGDPVVTQPSNYGGDFIYGGRVSQSMPKYYSIGISALQTTDSGVRLREEEGVDLWLHPFSPVEVVGRSSYNSVTTGWMEHAYTISLAPLDALRLNAELTEVNYKDYFHHVTTSALSLTNGIINPNESVLTLGGSIDFTPVKNLTLAVDCRHRDYELAGKADYYGGKAGYSLPGSFAAGFAIHRMDGKQDKLKYDEYHVYATKKIGKVDVTADYFSVFYDQSINGVRNAYAITAAAGYELTEQLKLAADVDFGRNPDFSNEVKGFFKVTYAFDTKHGAEGGAKSEK